MGILASNGLKVVIAFSHFLVCITADSINY